MRLSRPAIVLGVAAIVVALLGISLTLADPSKPDRSEDNQGLLNYSLGI
jgi:hypothetical protein